MLRRSARPAGTLTLTPTPTLTLTPTLSPTLSLTRREELEARSGALLEYRAGAKLRSMILAWRAYTVAGLPARRALDLQLGALRHWRLRLQVRRYSGSL